jgi:hypothetical protein
MSNTEHRNYPKPVPDHFVSDDVILLQQAMDLVDGDINLLFAAIADLAPKNHEHVIADIQGLSSALAGKAAANHAHTLEDLSDVGGTLVAPAGYLLVKLVDGTWGPVSPASVVGAHQHVIADVQNLQTALDGLKAENQVLNATDAGMSINDHIGMRRFADGVWIKRTWTQVINFLNGYYQRRDGTQAMVGNLTISKAEPVVFLNKPASGTSNQLIGQTAGVTRWGMQMGHGGAEAGANAGSDYALDRYADNGTWIDTAFGIVRSAGTVWGSIYATAAQYLANTAGKVLTTAGVWAAAIPVNLGTPAGAVNLDFGTFINGYMNPSGNITFNTATNLKPGQSGSIRIYNPPGYTLGVNTSRFITSEAKGITLGINRNIVSYYVDDESMVHLFLSGKVMS